MQATNNQSHLDWQLRRGRQQFLCSGDASIPLTEPYSSMVEDSPDAAHVLLELLERAKVEGVEVTLVTLGERMRAFRGAVWMCVVLLK